MSAFPTDLESILRRVEQIKPIEYARTRNFENGAVTRLSPYISRGVISTKVVFEHLMKQSLPFERIEKLVQELAWRDYWQQVWIAKGSEINQDLKRPQVQVDHWETPTALLNAETGIEAIDRCIEDLYNSGYMHNHMRMYVAALSCNIARSHWKNPARWMYYHLLDGDWASNALSWQWVAGSNANKKYIANQDNINKYFNSEQKGSFLDVSYESLATLEPPLVLQAHQNFSPTTNLPQFPPLAVDPSKPTFIYNYYNLDPKWHQEIEGNRVMLFEPNIFKAYPVGERPLQFAIELSKNIEGIQYFVGTFDDLKQQLGESSLFFKEHPLNQHYKGNEDPRDWMFPVTGYFNSFFGFWKKCQKLMKKNQLQLNI